MTKSLDNLKGLGPVDVARLASFKLRRHVRDSVDRAGGPERLLRRREATANEWLGAHGAAGIEAWLHRPGAGVWWRHLDLEAWAREECTPADLALADEAVAGRFTVLSAQTAAENPPSWRRDLYTGVDWPLEPSSTLAIMRGDGSDIRTVWELSRCHHFLALGRAWAMTGDARYPETFATHVRSFSAQNPPGLGPHWASPMDVAIRAANWCVAVQLFQGATLSARFWADMLADLRLAGCWIEEHLEWHPVYRGNHYVANLVGLVYLGVLFRGTTDGDRWLRRGSRRLQHELNYQVGYDGVAFEGSLAYHRLHTELFAWAGELLRRNDPMFPAEQYDIAVGRMVDFIACYTQPDGRAPLLGDADDGRLHATSALALHDPRFHAVGLPDRYKLPVVGDGAYPFPAGGFHILRSGGHHAVIRCGPVGLRGAGSHDHNDQLSFELVVGGRRLVSDSGTYAYTRDLEARHAYRSTAAHSVVQLGGEEQNPIDVRRPWRVLEDRTRGRLLCCDVTEDRLVFAGEHHGYAHRPSGAVCRRILELDPATGAWLLEDQVLGTGTEDLAWRLHLEVPVARVTGAAAPADGVAHVECADEEGNRFGIELRLPEGAACRVVEGRASNAYGEEHRRPVLEVTGKVRVPATVACVIRKLEGETH